MDRNDIICQGCGRYIFNGLDYWCVPYARECKDATSKNHTFRNFACRRSEGNGYMFCPTCAKKHENRCPVCVKPLIVKRAWKSAWGIRINGKYVEVSFTMISKEGDASTKFSIAVDDVKTEHIIDFDESDQAIFDTVDDAVQAALGKCEWVFC